ncbi:hypothetical protein PPERSA_04347 [Pseudocohnilembus persalinus]|uniref:Uncharacterized protein n=1 Tax=Pseudocohnilembus persalinus TaxID=266149 RepID=A0A0V0QQK3_PSEPJ|nr:hypothetical protein PPERSA_04347 [Pseudocohnilembus persalinus]|eukprot:KRX04532.1 hypothetical protein PPERSA_04347 [Pseudocohnilembus persalinus]
MKEFKGEDINLEEKLKSLKISKEEFNTYIKVLKQIDEVPEKYAYNEQCLKYTQNAFIDSKKKKKTEIYYESDNDSSFQNQSKSSKLIEQTEKIQELNNNCQDQILQESQINEKGNDIDSMFRIKKNKKIEFEKRMGMERIMPINPKYKQSKNIDIYETLLNINQKCEKQFKQSNLMNQKAANFTSKAQKNYRKMERKIQDFI